MASCNVLVLGGRGVGKTALISTFVNGAFRKVSEQPAEITIVAIAGTISEYECLVFMPGVPEEGVHSGLPGH